MGVLIWENLCSIFGGLGRFSLKTRRVVKTQNVGAFAVTQGDDVNCLVNQFNQSVNQPTDQPTTRPTNQPIATKCSVEQTSKIEHLS